MEELDEGRFWELIELVGDIRADEDPYAGLVAELASLPVEDILGFEETLARLLHQLDRQDLGDLVAAWCDQDPQVHGGRPAGEPPYLSGDLFLYLRCGIVVAGREAYRAVLADVQRAVPLLDWEQQDEQLLEVGPTAFQLATGEKFDHETRYSYESWSNAEGWD